MTDAIPETMLAIHHHEAEDPGNLAPFNPTCCQAQMTALKLLMLNADDVLFDLGCGDGKFLINAATHTEGIRCVGIELNHKFFSRGKEAIDALSEDIKSRILLREGDILIEGSRSTIAASTWTSIRRF